MSPVNLNGVDSRITLVATAGLHFAGCLRDRSCEAGRRSRSAHQTDAVAV